MKAFSITFVLFSVWLVGFVFYLLGEEGSVLRGFLVVFWGGLFVHLLPFVSFWFGLGFLCCCLFFTECSTVRRKETDHPDP